MATIVTAVVDFGLRQGWEIPNPIQFQPRALITYDGTTTIPALLVGNQALYELDVVLPKNFVYRLKSIELSVYTESATVTDGFAQGMSVNFVVNGITRRSFSLFNAYLVGSGPTFAGFLRDPDITLRHATTFLPNPAQYFDSPILADAAPLGRASIFVRYAEFDTVVRAALDVRHHVEVFQYDREQYNHWQMNSPYPTSMH